MRRTMAVPQLRMTSAVEESNAWLSQWRAPGEQWNRPKRPWRMHLVYWLAPMMKVETFSFPFLPLSPAFPRGLSSLTLRCPLVEFSFTPLLCLTTSVARTSFLLSTYTEGQTPFLQPAGILLMMLREDTKLDSRGGQRIGQQRPSLLQKNNAR